MIATHYGQEYADTLMRVIPEWSFIPIMEVAKQARCHDFITALISQDGVYRWFVEIRSKSEGWKI